MASGSTGDPKRVRVSFLSNFILHWPGDASQNFWYTFELLFASEPMMNKGLIPDHG